MRAWGKVFKTGLTVCAVSAVLLTGCGSRGESETALAEKGYLTLRVNPEILIEYDREGRVTDLTGENDDGKKIVADYQDYIGKECDVVVSDLIEEIHQAGYFVEEIDGNSKNIVIQVESGSVLPDDDFVEQISSTAQTTVKNMQLQSGVVSIDDDDYDDKYKKAGKPSLYITLEKAQEIALAQADIAASAAVFDDKEFDLDDGRSVYELEFTANGYEYEYDIDATSGKVLKAEHERIVANTADGSHASGTQAATVPAKNDDQYDDDQYDDDQYDDDQYDDDQYDDDQYDDDQYDDDQYDDDQYDDDQYDDDQYDDDQYDDNDDDDDDDD